MIKNKGIFIIKFERQDEEFVENLDFDILKKGYDKAKEFFEYNGEIIPIRICFLYSPEEFLFFSGYPKYENWMRACTGHHNTIYIFAPSVVKKYTIHKKNDILKVLIHEISHLFYGYSSMKKNIVRFPLWDEGIANYIANKKTDCNTNFNVNTLRNFSDRYSMNYIAGYKLIKSIMNKFGNKGNKKILEFLTKAKQSDNEKALFEKFEEVFGMNVKFFIEMKGGKNGK